MDLTEHFRRLLKHDMCANQEEVALLRVLSEPPPAAVRFLAHIVSAEHVWLSRLKKTAQPFPVWSEFTLAQAAEQVRKLGQLWAEYYASQLPGSLREECGLQEH